MQDIEVFKYMIALADPDLQKRGGAKFLTKFCNDLILGISRKISAFPKIPHLSFFSY